jgi:hypothetical protein
MTEQLPDKCVVRAQPTAAQTPCTPVKLVAVLFLGWSPLKRACRLAPEWREAMLAVPGSWGGRELRAPSGSSTSSVWERGRQGL